MNQKLNVRHVVKPRRSLFSSLAVMGSVKNASIDCSAWGLRIEHPGLQDAVGTIWGPKLKGFKATWMKTSLYVMSLWPRSTATEIQYIVPTNLAVTISSKPGSTTTKANSFNAPNATLKPALSASRTQPSISDSTKPFARKSKIS